jgi:hypothetical protein
MDLPVGHPEGVVDGKAEQVPGRGGDGGTAARDAAGTGCGDDDGRWPGDGTGHNVLALHLFGGPAWLAVRLMAGAMWPADEANYISIRYFEACDGLGQQWHEGSPEVSVQVSDD